MEGMRKQGEGLDVVRGGVCAGGAEVEKEEG